jgi:hypothetical protein
VLVVKGAGLDASTYKSGEIEIKCDYSCTQDVAVVATVISDHVITNVNSDLNTDYNPVTFKRYEKESIAHVATNERIDGALPEGYIKPPNAMKGINDYSPTIKRAKEVHAGGSGGMPGTDYNYSYSL